MKFRGIRITLLDYDNTHKIVEYKDDSSYGFPLISYEGSFVGIDTPRGNFRVTYPSHLIIKIEEFR